MVPVVGRVFYITIFPTITRFSEFPICFRKKKRKIPALAKKVRDREPRFAIFSFRDQTESGNREGFGSRFDGSAGAEAARGPQRGPLQLWPRALRGGPVG